MTDINSKSNREALPNGTAKETTLKVSNKYVVPLSARHEDMLTLMELFYFAYRDFTGDGDEVLAKIGFGRAHHRVIHFVYHYPGLRVAEILGILKITKQSLARVLKQLIDQNFICQRAGEKDRRERHLFTTEKGTNLARQLSEPQINRFENTVTPMTQAEQETIEKFLFSLIQQGNRHDVITLMAQNGHFPSEKSNDPTNIQTLSSSCDIKEQQKNKNFKSE